MNTVIVFVQGGLVQDVQVPKGTKVFVRDYDVSDYCTEEELKQHDRDKDGNYYLESEWAE